MKLNDLKLNESNPRFIRDEKFAKLVQSIRDFPKMLELRPIVIDAEGVVLGGNMRLRALQEIGYDDIPDEWVKRADELTDEQKREFIIKDNVGFGEWAWDTLANEWDGEQLEEWGLDVPDAWGEAKEAEEDDYEEPENLPVDVVPGDLIEIGPHRLLCGDSTSVDDIDRLMGGELADAVCTDPPYGQNQPGVTNDTPGDHERLLRDCVTILPVENAAIVAFNSPRTFPNWLIPSISAGHKFHRMLWLYKKAQNSYPFKGWLLTSEAILLTSVGDPNWNDVHPYRHDCYEVSEVSGELPEGIGWHGSVKPVLIVSDLIERTSLVGQKIYDPFTGSGTTMVAAHQLDRICYGMEIDPKYCQVIIDRMHRLDPALPIKINGKVYTPREPETA